MDRKDSAALVFSVIKSAGHEGIDKQKLSRAVQRHLDSSGLRDAILAQLFAAKSIAIRTVSSGGRPTERYYAVDTAPRDAMVYGGASGGSKAIEAVTDAVDAVNAAIEAACRVDASCVHQPASPAHAVVLSALRRIDPAQASSASVNGLAEMVITHIRADIRAAIRDIRAVEPVGSMH